MKSQFSVIYTLLALVILIVAFAACTKKPLLTTATTSPLAEAVVMQVDSLLITLDPKCHIEGPIVMQLKEQEGYVGYREGLWYVAYSPRLKPNEASDAAYSGFVCNMPKSFQRAGRKVKFSGNYYHAYKYIPKAHAGDTPLYLILTNIQWGDTN